MYSQVRYASVMVCLIVIAALLGCAGDRTRKSTGQAIDDGAIAAKVKSALIADPEVKGTQVQVEVYKGVVQLSGFVDSPVNAQRAVTIARNVPGVAEVRNSLIVK
jgi:osmotically-inducible protein OsmY